MKLNKYSLALILGFSTLFSCSDRMDLLNPNQQTSSTFGFNANDLEESVIAAYNHIRMEGSYARVGYTIDVCRGDEAWNSSQVWYLPFDDLNAEVTSDITWWPWREWYYTINVCNFAISRCGEDNSLLSDKMKRIKGQVLFLRGLSYYNLVGYYQNPPLITDSFFSSCHSSRCLLSSPCLLRSIFSCELNTTQFNASPTFCIAFGINSLGTIF